MLKILQARLQQYMNCGLPDVQAGFRKGRGTRDQIANIRWIIEKAREFQKIIYFCFIDYANASDCVDHNKLQKILQEMGIPDHLTCLLRIRSCVIKSHGGSTGAMAACLGEMQRIQLGYQVPLEDCLAEIFKLRPEGKIEKSQVQQ